MGHQSPTYSRKHDYSDSSSSVEVSKRKRNKKFRHQRRRKRERKYPSSSSDSFVPNLKNRKPLRRKESLYWDLPPVGFENVPPAQYKEMLRNGQALASVAPYARQVLVPILSATVVRQARRLYVGNIPFGVTEEEMIMFFNNQMHLMNLSQAEGKPVLACQINLKKSFAFLEFRSIDETTQAMALNSISFKGQNLKVRRPHDYQPLHHDKEEVKESKVVAPVIPGVVSNIVPDSPNKIFIGGLRNFLKEDQVMEILQAFGDLRGFNLIKDVKTGDSKGYAFCEFMDSSLTNMAIASLNGMSIGDRKITVQLANVGAKIVTESKTHEITEILCLLNMVTTDDLEDDDELDDIMSDIREECEKYGIVRSIEIPRPVQNEIVKGCGKVYVEYNTVFDSIRAQQALSGRQFNGRTVVTSYYNSEKYHRREFN